MMSRYQAYPEYKDSGVEWLGDTPVHWKAKQLKFLCTYNDEALPDSTSKDYELEYVDIGSVSAIDGISKTEAMLFEKAPSRARRVVRDGDVIISTVRTYLEAIAAIDNPPENLIVSTGFAVIRPNPYLHKGYAAYCLRANGFIKEVVARSVGVSYPAINASDLVNIKVPEPTYEEQEKIAGFLDHETAKIDTLIDKQQQLIQLLKEKRQAVISHAVTKGLNPNAPMRDSGVEWLGEVPEHWEVTPLKFLINDRKGAVKAGPFGSHLKNSDMEGSDIKVISQRNIISRDFDIGESMISFDKYKELQGFTIFKNDILVTTRGTIGRTLVYDRNNLAILHPCLIRLQVKSNFVFPELIALIIQESGYAMEQILLNSNATTIEVIYSENLINTIICLPLSLVEQQEILDYISKQKNNFDHLIGKAQSAIDLMQERRTALISAAVTGKIDVRHPVCHPTGDLQSSKSTVHGDL